MRAKASYLSISKSCSLSAKDKLMYPQVKPTSASEELQRVWSVWDPSGGKTQAEQWDKTPLLQYEPVAAHIT